MMNMKTGYTTASAILLFLAAAYLSILFLVIPLHIFPFEDAAILFLYSENLADTGNITYNAGGPPVEGATDFLWMALLSVFYKAGVPTYQAATALSLAALVGSAALIARLARLPAGWFPPLLLLLAVQGEGLAAVMGFSNVFFSFFLLLMAYGFLEGKWRAMLAFGLITCLIRPDGVFFAVPLTLAFMALHHRHGLKELGDILLLAVLPGAAYFAWRWHYFGLPLPLPFYVKSHFDDTFLWFSIRSLKSAFKLLALCLPAWLVLAYSLHARPRLKPELLLAGAGMALPLLCYLSFFLDQNVYGRFYYPFTLFTILLVVRCRRRIPRALFALSLGWLFAVGALYSSKVLLEIPLQANDNRACLGEDLRQLQTKSQHHYVMATAEAGYLPYYSRWEAVDLGGLNTPAFAGKLPSLEAIRAAHPDVLFFCYGSLEEYFPRMLLSEEKEAFVFYDVPPSNQGQCNEHSFFRTHLRERTVSRHKPALLTALTAADWKFILGLRKDAPDFAALEAIVLAHGGTRRK
jgi:hypothetical protein